MIRNRARGRDRRRRRRSSRLVHELAEYEKAPEECHLTDEQLHDALFGDDPVAHALVAERAGTVVGVAIWFRTFSTWEGVAGMHLEDLYVRPEHRGGGHGARLLAALARICDERGWARLEWNVLDWNAPAIGFYERLGASPERRVDDLPADRGGARRPGGRATRPGSRRPSTSAGTGR